MRRYLLLHAGVVAFEDQGIVLPAASGHGKTTLTAALIASGFQYLSDEVAVLDAQTHHLLPFAKSLYIRSGARDALLSLHPRLAEIAPYRPRDNPPVWYLPPCPEWLPRSPTVARFVICPRYVPGASVTLAPISRSTALQCFLDQSFNVREHGGRGIQDLAAILRDTRCYTLSFGNLDEAVAAVQEIVGASGP
ncbi:MAG TPA: hypothetical protein VFZ25_21705 [Chloroflexota bacterium]|nr:hypothetical protein [Chloroflexota bacterium]